MRKQSGFTIIELLIVIVIIGILAGLVTIAYSGISNKANLAAMKADLHQWKEQSEAYKITNNIECPDNYVFFYGNSTLGTTDFCVMKYAAKIQGQANGNQVYNNNYTAESRPTGTPWVNISQTNAISESAALGPSYHLISEAEWMTIAADVLSVKWNWSRLSVGSGYIYSGHSDDVPSNSLAADADDDEGYTGTGNSGAIGDNQRRTLYLTSGDTIWDLAGNVSEWTSDTITPTHIGVSGDSTFSWRQWNLGSLSMGNLPSVSKPSMLSSLPGLSDVKSWTSNQGIGSINANYADTAFRTYRRGGEWSVALRSGVLSLRLSSDPGTGQSSIGFRAIYR